MNIPKEPSTLKEFKRQNEEIIRTNTKLNERITTLEILVSKLQNENFQLRLHIAKNKPNQREKTIPKKRTIHEANSSNSSSQSQPLSHPSQQENIPTDNTTSSSSDNDSKEHAVNDLIITTHTKRSCSSKPINYVLPSAKRKLRKGDPYTFGNE